MKNRISKPLALPQTNDQEFDEIHHPGPSKIDTFTEIGKLGTSEMTTPLWEAR